MADSDEADRILVPKDRVFERTMGCWNCFNRADPKPVWNNRRQADLKRALDISMSSKLGENHPKCMNIKHMVNKIDHLVASKAIVSCRQGLTGPIGRLPSGEPVGHFIAPNYLCDRWTAAQGASIARAGQAPDTLPEELADKLGDARPPDQDEINAVVKALDEDN